MQVKTLITFLSLFRYNHSDLLRSSKQKAALLDNSKEKDESLFWKREVDESNRKLQIRINNKEDNLNSVKKLEESLDNAKAKSNKGNVRVEDEFWATTIDDNNTNEVKTVKSPDIGRSQNVLETKPKTTSTKENHVEGKISATQTVFWERQLQSSGRRTTTTTSNAKNMSGKDDHFWDRQLQASNRRLKTHQQGRENKTSGAEKVEENREEMNAEDIKEKDTFWARQLQGSSRKLRTKTSSAKDEKGSFWKQKLQNSARKIKAKTESAKKPEEKYWERQLQGSGRRMKSKPKETNPQKPDETAFWSRSLQSSGRKMMKVDEKKFKKEEIISIPIPVEITRKLEIKEDIHKDRGDAWSKLLGASSFFEEDFGIPM